MCTSLLNVRLKIVTIGKKGIELTEVSTSLIRDNSLRQMFSIVPGNSEATSVENRLASIEL
jgi:hypothetical protein